MGPSRPIRPLLQRPPAPRLPSLLCCIPALCSLLLCHCNMIAAEADRPACGLLVELGGVLGSALLWYVDASDSQLFVTLQPGPKTSACHARLLTQSYALPWPGPEQDSRTHEITLVSRVEPTLASHTFLVYGEACFKADTRLAILLTALTDCTGPDSDALEQGGADPGQPHLPGLRGGLLQG